MSEYAVTITRLVTTVLKVDAPSAAAAKKQIEDYGVIEAWSDYTRTEESDIGRVSKVKKL